MSFQKDLAELEKRLFPGDGSPCKNAKALYKLAYNAVASYLEENKKNVSSAMYVKSKCDEYIIYKPKGWFEFTKYKVDYPKLRKLDTTNLLRLIKHKSKKIGKILELDEVKRIFDATAMDIFNGKSKLYGRYNHLKGEDLFQTILSGLKKSAVISAIIHDIHESLGKIVKQPYTDKPWITLRYAPLDNENLWKATKLLSSKTAEDVIIDAFVNETYEYSVFKINQNFAIEVADKTIKQH